MESSITQSSSGTFRALEDSFPHPFLGQPAEALAHGIGLAKPFGQIGPRHAGAQYPEHSIEKQPVICGCHAAVTGLARQQRAQQRSIERSVTS
ncbi:MAG: hypothetical protein WKG07_10535 [Hymenobacter sp.]